MKLYQKNKIFLHFILSGDASELFEHGLPFPNHYSRRNEQIYVIAWLIDGYFHTAKGREFLNDIIARIILTLPVVSRMDVEPKKLQHEQSYKLKAFQGIQSLPSRFKAYEDRTNSGHDKIFYAIKWKTEQIIKHQGEGKLIAYSLIEGFAFDNFETDAKDKSTLKAKCRAVWNWYDAREWTIPKRKRESTMSRQEAGRTSAQKKAAATKAKVIGAVKALEFLQEKITPTSVSRHAGISRPTATKYLKELGIN